MYLPWSRVSRFECYACGVCCYHFRVPLRPYEVAKITSMFGGGFIEVVGEKVLIRKPEGGPCPFLDDRGLVKVCSLHELGIKPRACKLWPFRIYRRPEHGRAEEAMFSHREGTFYVYLDTRCPGVIPGRPDEAMVRSVEEAIEIWLGIRRDQRLTASSAPRLTAGIKKLNKRFISLDIAQ